MDMKKISAGHYRVYRGWEAFDIIQRRGFWHIEWLVKTLELNLVAMFPTRRECIQFLSDWKAVNYGKIHAFQKNQIRWAPVPDRHCDDEDGSR